MKGAFQTSREIFENPIWQDIPKFRIFFYIVGNSVYAEEGAVVAGVPLKRGQFLRAYRNLIKDLEYIENRSVKRYSLSVISRKVDQLVKEERLKIEDTELGTLFTVVNYAQYQGFDYYKKKTWDGVGTDLERSENGVGTELEQGWNNNNKENKENKDKKDKKKKDIIPKISFSESVELTRAEHDRLVSEFGEDVTKKAIDYLTSYKAEKGYKTKSDNLTIRRWVIDAVTKQKGGTSFGKHPGGNAGHASASRANERGKERTREPKTVSKEVIQEINNFE